MVIRNNDRFAAITPGFLIVLAAAALFPGRGAVLLDDSQDILQNPALHSSLIDALFHTNNPFRCLTYLTYWLNLSMPGGGIAALHITNILLHIASGCLLFIVLRAWPGERDMFFAAVVAAGAFLLNPLMMSTPLYISARSSMLVAIGALLAVWGLLRYFESGKKLHAIAAWVGAGIALLSKETGIIVPALLIVVSFLTNNRRRGASIYLPMLAAAAIFTILRLSFHFDLGDRGSGISGPFEYLLTQFTVIPRYLDRFFWPINLGLDWDVPARHGLGDPTVLLCALLLLFLFSISIWAARRNKMALAFIIWIPISLSVESSVIPLADLAFDHRFYLAGIGVSALAGMAVESMYFNIQYKKLAASLIIAAMICEFALGINRGAQWSTTISAWNEAVSVAPDGFRPRYNLGHNFLEAGLYREALPQLNAAIRIGGKVPGETAMALNARGLVYLRKGNSDAAMDDFYTAVTLWPNYGDPILHLGVTYLVKGRADDAYSTLECARQLTPDDPKVINAMELAGGLVSPGHETGCKIVSPR